MKVVVDNKIPYLEGALEPFVDVEYIDGSKINRQTIANADALIIRTRTHCNSNLLEGSGVKFIATATIGYDHIDTQYCESKGIHWTNTPGCNAGSVMQFVASAIVTYAHENKIELQNRVLGVIGVGNVGKKVVSLGELLGMQVLLNDPPRLRREGVCGFLSLEGILREADIISLHVPLSYEGPDKTFHLVGDYFLNHVNPNTLLINSSRGEVVESQVLKNALNKKKLNGAILDVWENEPSIDLDLLGKVTIATPHIAGYSADGKKNGTAMAVQALSKFFNLGIDDWEPELITNVEDSIFELDAKNLSWQQFVSKCILHTYNIRRDEKGLRTNPSKFEFLRGNYPLRREFEAYTIKAANLTHDFKKRLLRLGFKVAD